MDVLVSLGTNASYGYSLISILHHHLMVRAALPDPAPPRAPAPRPLA